MKLKIGVFIILLVVGFLVRLYRFDNPIADWHSFRQSDTAAVSLIYVKEGYDLLHPKYFDISNVQSGFDNPKGYRFVEFPIYNLIHAFLYKEIGIFSFIGWGRFINILASLVTSITIFLLVKKYVNSLSAFFSLAFFLLLPFSIYYSRTILPDTMMTTSIMLGIYFFDKWLDNSKVNPSAGGQKSKLQIKSQKYLILNTSYFLLAMFFTAVSLLLKPFAIFFTLPIIYIALIRFGLKVFLKWNLWLFAAASIAPFLLWRQWISQFPEGIPASNWLFNGNGIRFRPSFFRWIFFERITKLIFGYAGILFLLAGAYKTLKDRKRYGLFIAFLLSSFLYFTVIATGNVQHDYYQILILTTLAMLAGIGLSETFYFILKRVNLTVSVFVCGAVILFAFFFSWNLVKDYFNVNDRGMVIAGERANDILPEDAIVIAPFDGSTTMLNTTQRRGWPVFQNSIEELIDKGAEYMVIANPTENDFSGFGTTYEIVDSSDQYLILKLK